MKIPVHPTGSFQNEYHEEVVEPMMAKSPTPESIELEAPARAHCKRPMRTVPERALPNIRIVVDMIGAQKVIILIGKKTKIGSVKRLK